MCPAKKIKDLVNESSDSNDSNEKLVIVLTQPRGLDLPPFSKGTEDEKKGQTLAPGENAVSKDLWAFVENNPAIKKYMEVGFLINKGPGIAKPLVETLDSFNRTDGREVIRKEKDIEQLERWIKGTKDEHLIQACKDRRKKLVKGK